MKIRNFGIFLVGLVLVLAGCPFPPTGSPQPTGSPKSSAKAITAFTFASPAGTGFIDEGGKTITVKFPQGASRLGLVPDIIHTGVSINPADGVARDFSSPVVYTVTAEDGSTQVYTVTVDNTITSSTHSGDYLDTTPGKSNTYTIQYPASYASSKPDHINVTFQSASSTGDVKGFFTTIANNRLDSAKITINGTGIRYNGGLTGLLCGTLMQKLILPDSLPESGTANWEVTEAWYGPGTYTITPLVSFTVAGNTYSDCMKIDFPDSKLNYTNQHGYGFYVLARGLGTIYYTATLAGNGMLGSTGETITYSLTAAINITPRMLNLRILDENSNPCPGYLDFMGGAGPSLQADAAGNLSVQVYLPAGDTLGNFYIYLTKVYNQGEYPKSVNTPASPVGDINLGDVQYTLPQFSPATIVELSPANGATGVDAAATTRLRVTFSQPMGTGYAFCSVSGSSFPSFGTAVWLSNTVIELPVTLVPGTTYTLSINNSLYLGFRDTTGYPFHPMLWSFTTAP